MSTDPLPPLTAEEIAEARKLATDLFDVSERVDHAMCVRMGRFLDRLLAAAERLAEVEKQLADERHALDYARKQFAILRDHAPMRDDLRDAIKKTIAALDLVIASRQRKEPAA